MAQHFDPRKVLRSAAKPMLREFFARRGELLDVPWDDLNQRTLVPVVYNAWQRLPGPQRREVQAILQDLVELSDDRGIRSFAEEVRTAGPDRAWLFKACETRLNKALWFYLNFRDRFDQATLFARADALSAGRYAVRWNGLPKIPLVVTPEMTQSLAASLRDHYWPNEMRGEKCRVDHYSRPGGSEYFFAYLDDWPDMRLMFLDNGDMVEQIARYAFSVVFAACPSQGSLELMAKGGSDVRRILYRRFCQSVYGLDAEPVEQAGPVYNLQRLLDPDFTYPTELADCVGRVSLARIGWAPASDDDVVMHLTKFKPWLTRNRWLASIHRQLRGSGLTPSDVTVKLATLQLEFVKDGLQRDKTLTFTMSLPSYCDLKSKPDDVRVVAERLVERWELISA